MTFVCNTTQSGLPQNITVIYHVISKKRLSRVYRRVFTQSNAIRHILSRVKNCSSSPAEDAFDTNIVWKKKKCGITHLPSTSSSCHDDRRWRTVTGKKKSSCRVHRDRCRTVDFSLLNSPLQTRTHQCKRDWSSPRASTERG